MRDLAAAPESLFWYWINERHSIYLRRTAGEPKPWTQDPILQQYKFTNVFRQLDRGTVWLRENFLEPHQDAPLDLLAFNICWYRMFNWWGTGEQLGWQYKWDANHVKGLLTAALEDGQQVFTGAHIVYSRPGFSKIDAIVDVCSELWEMRHGIVEMARSTRSLQATFETVKEADSVGGFMGYEMVSDMRWTHLLEDATDILTWANPGPGAKRGLQRLLLPYKPDARAIESMQYLLARQRPVFRFGSHETDQTGASSHVPPLEMRDIEHSLCEFDKYCRVKFNEGEPRSKFNGR